MYKITLPYPPTVNHYYRNTRQGAFLTQKGIQYRTQVQFAVLGNKIKPLNGSLRMLVDIYPPDRRKRDIDNICKALLDSLEKAGVYENDNQISDLHLVRKEVYKGGKVVVTISS